MNSSPFAGGVAQGKFGVAGYIVGYNSSAMSSGTFIEEADTKITARKSYFMFDNEIVCVGTGINDFSGDNVITVVENRKWGSDDLLYIDGTPLFEPATAQTTISARTMHFSNMGGYVFLRAEAAKPYDGATLTYQKASHVPLPSVSTGQFDATSILGVKKDFLEIIINHGIGDGNVENNKYVYAYLPEATVQETADYYEDPDTELLAYLDDIHAVIEKELGIVAANFFVEGSSRSISVANKFHTYTNVREISSETPCSVMISKNEAGETVITVSDPTMTYRNTILDIELSSLNSVVSKDDKIDAQIDGNILHLNISTLNSSGTGFTVIVK
jgi:hyaluronate lyase